MCLPLGLASATRIAASCATTAPPHTRATQACTTATSAASRASTTASSTRTIARTEADRALDAGRHPAELLALLDLRPSARVADLMAGGGYTAELLARAVGSQGVVYGQNNRFVLERFAEGPTEAPSGVGLLACEGFAGGGDGVIALRPKPLP